MLHVPSGDAPWRLSVGSVNKRWRQRFEGLRHRHASVVLAHRPELPSKVEGDLLSSLAVFQLGESGDGEHLLGAAATCADDDYQRAAELFIAEEQRHAELLAMVLGLFDQPLLTEHWSHRVFKTVRRGSGLRSELLVLLLAEVVGLRYYEALRDGLDDTELSVLFGAIAADEHRHLEFHADTLHQFLSDWPRPVFYAVRAGWNVAVRAASVFAAVSHRRILRHCDVGILEFTRRCWSTVRTHEANLFERGATSTTSAFAAAS